MSDITTVWSADGTHGDYRISEHDLASGDDLQTAVLISLFSDRLALADDITPDGTTDRRGWWADDDQLPIGSRLWLLERAKLTTETLQAARDYIVEALQWLIDAGAVDRFEVLTERTRAGLLGAQVTAYRPDGSVQALRYAWTWAAESLPDVPPSPAPAPSPGSGFALGSTFILGVSTLA